MATAKTYSADQVQQMIEAAVTRALSEQKASSSAVIVKEQTVTLLFIGNIAKGTVVTLNEIGKINRDGGTITVPKSMFLQHIDSVVDSLLAERKLIVLDGLDDEERERYDVIYKPDELLTQKQFSKLLNYSVEDICAIFSKLCYEHRKIVANAFISALADGNANVTLEKVQALNEISKTKGDGTGLFKPLIEDFGATLACK